jgi:predicted acylesterase/phospholipase RssA
MDGGVANNKPISHAVELGARRIYVLPTGHACALAEPPAALSVWRCMPSASSHTGG